MSKASKPAPVAGETKTDEQTANVNELNAQQSPIEPPKPPTKDELFNRWKELASVVNGLFNADNIDDDKLLSAQIEADKAKQLYRKAVEGEKAEAAKKEFETKLNAAWDTITSTLGVSRETIENGLKDSVVVGEDKKETYKPSTLKVALQTILGKPVIHVAEGQTGKSLVKKTSNGDGSNRTSEIMAKMDSGATYDNLIADGYADGTIRSAAWKGGYKKNSDGSYRKG